MEPVLVKIGGEIVDHPYFLKLFLTWLQQKYSQNQPVVIVHGAGKQVDILSNRLDISTIKHQGRRVTDKKTLEVFIQAMAGSVNKKLLSEMRTSGLSAVGVTAADANISVSVRREPLNINGQNIDFGYVGEIEQIDTTFINLMLENQFIPVVGCLTWSKDDGLLNVNADTLAMKLAIALNCRTLILLTKTGAVLDYKKNPLGELNWKDYQKGLEHGWIKDGMIPKLQTGFESITYGVQEVVICSPKTLVNKNGTKLLKNEEL
jgi:acetylglutamate kinase